MFGFGYNSRKVDPILELPVTIFCVSQSSLTKSYSSKEWFISTLVLILTILF